MDNVPPGICGARTRATHARTGPLSRGSPACTNVPSYVRTGRAVGTRTGRSSCSSPRSRRSFPPTHHEDGAGSICQAGIEAERGGGATGRGVALPGPTRARTGRQREHPTTRAGTGRNGAAVLPDGASPFQVQRAGTGRTSRCWFPPRARGRGERSWMPFPPGCVPPTRARTGRCGSTSPARARSSPHAREDGAGECPGCDLRCRILAHTQREDGAAR